MNNKGFIAFPILIFAAAVAVGVVGYLGIVAEKERKLPKNIIIPLQSESTEVGASIDVSDWKTFISEQYNYSFMYPSDWRMIDSNFIEIDGVKIEVWDRDVFRPEGGHSVFSVCRVGPKNTSWCSTGDITLDLRQFAYSIWQTNKNEDNSYGKRVGDIVATFADGRPAYQFSLTGTYTHGQSGRSGFLLDGEHIFIVTESDSGNKFIIHSPSSEKLSRQILSTFRFLDN